VFRVLFHEPAIPSNTGNAIRLAAASGAELHLVEPLGFELDDRRLRRAGLDYHDLAVLHVHPDFDAAMEALLPARVYAFTTRATTTFTDISYRPGDVLLFGTETHEMPAHLVDDPRVTTAVRIPMLPGIRSLNLANCASIALFEAWRQNGFERGE
jgi:tRNA (cytidine/uridine-2'-O-)-methyltransferase